MIPPMQIDKTLENGTLTLKVAGRLDTNTSADLEDPDVTLSAAERPIGGLGILMVRKMSQSMSYERAHDRNYLTVVMKERK